MNLISYKNDKNLKKIFLEEIIKHRKADQIVQGTYGRENGIWKGCAVGCSIHSLNIRLNKTYSTSDHSVYETELGIPEWLARLEDGIFEGLSVEEAKLWPEKFAKAIPVGVNLEPVKWKFSTYLLKENIDRVLSLDNISDELKKQVVDSIRGVLKIYEDAIKSGEWNGSAAELARSAARSAEAAKSAAKSAAWLAAESAARSAAESAAWSAEAAWSAASSAA